MWRMLQHDVPEDFVLATGKTYSVREFVELAFSHVGMDIEWHGQGVDETGIDRKSGRKVVAIDPRYFRPTEVELLLGDAEQGHPPAGLGRPRSNSPIWCRKWSPPT